MNKVKVSVDTTEDLVQQLYNRLLQRKEFLLEDEPELEWLQIQNNKELERIYNILKLILKNKI